MIYTSGHLPTQLSGQVVVGRLALPLDAPAGDAAARLAGLLILASLRKELGTLDRLAPACSRCWCAVNSTPKFTQPPAVLNACSELFAHVFGPQAGCLAAPPSAWPLAALGVPVDIEAVFEIA